MTKNIELLFDFVSPNAYMVWQPLKDILKAHGASLTITPVFLGGMHKLTGNAPPMFRDADIKGKTAYAAVEMGRFIKKHKLTKFQMNPVFPFNSITLQRMLLAVEAERQAEFVELLLPAIWEDKQDVTDMAAMGGQIEKGGFNAQALFEKAQDPALKQGLIDNTQFAVDRGAFGIPTFFIGDEMYFGKERLVQIDEDIASS